MTSSITCDGPTCSKSRPLEEARRLCDEPWLTVDLGGAEPNLHFCSRTCNAAWATDTRPKPKPTVVEEPVRPDPPTTTPEPETHTVTGTHHQTRPVGFVHPRGRMRDVR